MNPKCNGCKKSITKRLPGLECSKCRQVVHSSTICSGLTTKQLAALRAADNLDWICGQCKQNRSSFIVPEADSDDEADTLRLSPHKSGIDVKKLLADISKEVEKTIKRELEPLSNSVDFINDKIDELTESVEIFQQKIKELEKKNVHLQNQNNHLETKISALEQRVNEREQEQLSNCIEIAGVPFNEKEDNTLIVKAVAKKLAVSAGSVKNIQRPYRGRARADTLLVELAEPGERSEWVQRARTGGLQLGDVVPDAAPDAAAARVFVREALTQHQRTLLWKAKNELRQTYKYIWCKDGKVLVRKKESDKVIVIRNNSDIQNLLC